MSTPRVLAKCLVRCYSAPPHVMVLLAVSAHDIDAAGLALDAELPPAWLAAELDDAKLTAKAPGHVTARLSRSGDDIVVRGRVKAALTTPCARCLEPAAVDVDTEISLLLQPARHDTHAHGKGGGKSGKAHESAAAKPPPKPPAKEEDEYEFTAAEADTDTYDGETVVLDPFVREAILLEAPNFPLCSESCPGIGPAEGSAAREPRLDPRLAPLSALKDKLRPVAMGPQASPNPAPAAPAQVANGAKTAAKASEPETKKKNKE